MSTHTVPGLIAPSPAAAADGVCVLPSGGRVPGGKQPVPRPALPYWGLANLGLPVLSRSAFTQQMSVLNILFANREV